MPRLPASAGFRGTEAGRRGSFARHQLDIFAALSEQLLMRPPPHDPPVAHDEDLVTVANRTEPVCNDDAGTSPAPEIVIDRLFDNRIQRRGGLVEDDHGRITCQRPRDLEPLSLAATE